MIPDIDIIEACRDKDLFGRWFREATTWAPWFAFLATLFALDMSPEQLVIYQQHTGRSLPPTSPFLEAWLVCGRRAGKSFILALVAVFLACFRSYAEYLGPGERATIIVIAADRKQARQILRYVKGLISGTPFLKDMIEGELRADGLDLNNSVSIEIGTASFKTSRGYSFAAVLCDEMAYWPTEDAAEPDFAILDALRPGMANIPGAVMLCASSPYAKRGALYDAFKRHYGRDDTDILVWRAATREMNESIPQAFIDRQIARDPASAAAEYGAEFRDDIGGWADLAIIEAAVDRGLMVRPPRGGIHYVGFSDPSGGARDSFTTAIAHLEGDTAVLDCLVECKAPFNPTTATKQMAAVLKSYRLSSTVGDKYAAEWVVDAFGKCGIKYEHSERDRSSIYLDALPLFTSGRARLIDNPKMVNQFASLERRTSSVGKDRVDHGPGGHDDLCNSAAGALVLAASKKQPMIITPAMLAQSMRPNRSAIGMRGAGRMKAFF